MMSRLRVLSTICNIALLNVVLTAGCQSLRSLRAPGRGRGREERFFQCDGSDASSKVRTLCIRSGTLLAPSFLVALLRCIFTAISAIPIS